MLMSFRSSSAVHVTAKKQVCMSLCNCFHPRRANSGKITTFYGVPVFDARVRRP